ncbi:hypothetical protein D3C76_1131410 [compost metagenome]
MTDPGRSGGPEIKAISSRKAGASWPLSILSFNASSMLSTLVDVEATTFRNALTPYAFFERTK